MKERPILFNGAMVRAILDGSKTQTRRVVKLTDSGRVRETGSPRNWHLDDQNAVLACPFGQPGDRLWVGENFDFLPAGGPCDPQACEIVYWATGSTEPRSTPANYNPMIYGHEKVRPSIHMPRWASRIDLEITGVRIERLRGISEADAKAEGIERGDGFPGWYRGPLAGDSAELQQIGTHFKIPTAFPRLAYQALWESINGPGSWDANPWVWVVEFRRIKP